jgi:hypothetical protein
MAVEIKKEKEVQEKLEQELSQLREQAHLIKL